jgi:rSAM/selenodomain-associated transferase 1
VRSGWLVVFAKLPRAGLVKTRLCPPLTPEEAAELYRCLLADVLEESARAARALGLAAVLAVDPPEGCAELAAGAPPGFRALAQRGPDLGARMVRVAREAAAAGAPCALLRGSDSPALGEATMREALHALAGGADLALSPDRDGGYGLVALGARALLHGLGRPALFDHPMSTASVLADTVGNAARLGLRVAQLAPGFDVDRFDDLRRLAAARHERVSLACPRTLALLDTRGWWPPEVAARGAGSSCRARGRQEP